MRSGGCIEIICGYIKAVFCVAITNLIFWGVSELESMSEFRIWLNFKWSLVGPPPSFIQLIIRHEAWSL